MKDFHIIIPARYHSLRLPGKLMMEINGMTVLERVYNQALQANPKSIIIATDHKQIANHALSFGAHVEITATTHASGTDRIAEVVARGPFSNDDIIVNVQGDEPFINPQLIQQVARIIRYADVPMATLCWPIEKAEQLTNPNVVKVIRDHNNNALYFSRAPIPFNRDEPLSIAYKFRHIGLYAYHAQFLLDLVKTPVCKLEAYESLEQLRVLWSAHKIRVDIASVKPPEHDINTIDDLTAARAQMY